MADRGLVFKQHVKKGKIQFLNPDKVNMLVVFVKNMHALSPTANLFINLNMISVFAKLSVMY